MKIFYFPIDFCIPYISELIFSFRCFQAALLLTDGQQSTRPAGDRSYSLSKLATKLSNRGIRVYVIGVGAEVDRYQLRSMVEAEHHLFLKDDFNQLNARIEKELVELNDLGCLGKYQQIVSFEYTFLYSAAQKVKKVRYWIFRTQEIFLVFLYVEFNLSAYEMLWKLYFFPLAV